MAATGRLHRGVGDVLHRAVGQGRVAAGLRVSSRARGHRDTAQWAIRDLLSQPQAYCLHQKQFLASAGVQVGADHLEAKMRRL